MKLNVSELRLGTCPRCGHSTLSHTQLGIPVETGCNPAEGGGCGCLYFVEWQTQRCPPLAPCGFCDHDILWHFCGDGYAIPSECRAAYCGEDSHEFLSLKTEGKDKDMEPEVGVGSPLKKWVCQCTSHVVNVKSGKTLRGPYIIRVSGDGLVATCMWCDSPFVMAEEGLPRKRKSKICGAHCPEGAHEH